MRNNNLNHIISKVECISETPLFPEYNRYSFYWGGRIVTERAI